MGLVLEVFLPVVVVFVLEIYLVIQSDSVKTTRLPGRPALTPTDAHACHCSIMFIVHQTLYLVESQRDIVEDNRLLKVVIYPDERQLLVVVCFF